MDFYTQETRVCFPCGRVHVDYFKEVVIFKPLIPKPNQTVPCDCHLKSIPASFILKAYLSSNVSELQDHFHKNDK